VGGAVVGEWMSVTSVACTKTQKMGRPTVPPAGWETRRVSISGY